MKEKVTLAIVSAVLVGALLAGGALATSPVGLSSSLLARFTVPASALTVNEQNSKLQLNFKDAVDVAVVKATLAAGGQTGWHRHPMDSVVVVTAGSLTVSMPDPSGKRCLSTAYAAGQAFEHTKDVHNFVAGAGGAEFYVLYMAPVGAGLGDFSPPVPEVCV